MAKRRGIVIQPPLAGIDKSGAYRYQPPYSTPNANNVWATETAEGRVRLGSRPGIGPSVVDRLGTAGVRDVRMLAPLTVVATDGFTAWTDSFAGSSVSSAWSAAAWGGSLPGVYSSYANVDTDETTVNAVAKAFTINTSNSYVIEIFIVPFAGEHHGTYHVYGKMNNSTPNVETDGIDIAVTMTGGTGTWTGTLKSYNAGVATTYTLTPNATSLGYAPSGWLSVLVAGSNISVFWNRSTLISSQAVTLGAGAGSRWGFGMTCTTGGGVCLIDQARLQYYSTTVRETRRTKLVASAGGKLYAESFIGRLSEVSTSLTLTTKELLQAAQRGQKLYIADYGDVLIDTTGSASGATLTADGISSSTVDKDDFVAVLSNGTGALTDGTYTISAVGSGSLTLSSAPGDGNCSVRIERAPKVYDPTAGTFTLLVADSGKGQVPTGSPVVCLYNDRLCFAKDHVCYQSRQGTFTDWDYGANSGDYQRAVATTASSSDTGQVGDVIVALMPHSDDYLIYGCKSSIWAQVGDIAYGGRIANISNEAGCIHKNAWCRGPEGSIFFMSWDGIWHIPPGGRSCENISKDRLPQDLMDIDTEVNDVAMAYDFRHNGMIISIVSKNEKSDRSHWWFDSKNVGFWPMSFDEDHEAPVLMNYQALAAADSSILFGCRDGYVRRMHDFYESDDGTAIGAYVDIGPIKLADDFSTGRIVELNGVLGVDSGYVDWSVRTADSHEQAIRRTTNGASGIWVDGYNNLSYPSLSGHSAVIRLTGSDTDPTVGLLTSNLGQVLTTETGARLRVYNKTLLRRWTVDSMSATLEVFGPSRSL